MKNRLPLKHILLSPFEGERGGGLLPLMRGVFLLLLLLFSCTRYDLELYDDGKADVHFTFDWTSRFKEDPAEVERMTLMWAKDGDLISNYDQNSTDITQWPTRNNTAMGRWPSGTYYVTAMKWSHRQEYSTMNFYRTNSHNDIYAKAYTTYVSDENAWDKGRTYMDEPETIGVATDTVVVSTVIDDLVFRDYRDPSTIQDLHIERPMIIQPMTTKLNVLVKVRGISYMQSMEGYITGLSTGFMLNQRWRLTEVGTMKLSNWRPEDKAETARRIQGEETEANVGWMTTTVETFGLPHGRELLKDRTPNSNYILLHFTLLDGRTIDFGYPVGLNIHYAGDDGTADVFTQSDVTLELDLVIDVPYYNDEEVPIMPYAQPAGSGQFDAQVEPWGDDVNVDVPM